MPQTTEDTDVDESDSVSTETESEAAVQFPDTPAMEATASMAAIPSSPLDMPYSHIKAPPPVQTSDDLLSSSSGEAFSERESISLSSPSTDSIGLVDEMQDDIVPKMMRNSNTGSDTSRNGPSWADSDEEGDELPPLPASFGFSETQVALTSAVEPQGAAKSKKKSVTRVATAKVKATQPRQQSSFGVLEVEDGEDTETEDEDSAVEHNADDGNDTVT